MDIFDIDQALPYLKQNYVLYCLDSKVILYLQDSMIVLYNEQWHSRIKLVVTDMVLGTIFAVLKAARTK